MIYFQGDAAEKIYLLQSGMVSLTYTDIETGQDIRETLGKGEFFGVKSALGHYPREENALVVQNSAVMAFSVLEFEQIAMKNGPLIIKMLKVFSNQMRRTHQQVATLMNSAGTQMQDAEDGLYHLGKYYFKNKKYAYARHVFDRYLKYYPNGAYVDEVQADFNAVVGYIARYGDGMIRNEDVADIDGLVPEDSASEDSTSESGGEEETGESASDPLVEKAYYDAVSLVSQEKYMQALPAFKKLADGDDPDFSPKSAFEIGRCLFLLEKYAECIQYYTQMIAKYPKHDSLGEALFYIGKAHEKTGSTAQAVGFYKKTLVVINDNENVTSMKAERALKVLEG